ncbi:hypothetical protein TMatcc_001099 [Talaromyces marneffei ATCC 18224]
MHTLFTILITIGALSSLVSSNQVVVFNKCTYPVYAWTRGPAGSQNIVIEPNNHYVEAMYQSPGGVDLRFTTVPDGLLTSSALARFTYNIDFGQIWYALTNLYGDPFLNHPLIVKPMNPSGHYCKTIRWVRGVPPSGRARMTWCGLYTRLHVYLCGARDDDNGQTED